MSSFLYIFLYIFLTIYLNIFSTFRVFLIQDYGSIS